MANTTTDDGRHDGARCRAGPPLEDVIAAMALADFRITAAARALDMTPEATRREWNRVPREVQAEMVNKWREWTTPKLVASPEVQSGVGKL